MIENMSRFRVRVRTFGSKLILGAVSALGEPNRNWTGAPRSPQRTWAENDMFRLLLLFDFAKSYGGLRPDSLWSLVRWRTS